jgi:sortase A
MSIKSRIGRGAARALLGGGLLALTYSAYVVIDGRAHQVDQRAVFEQARAAAPEAATALPATLREGDPLGIVAIPRLGLSVVVAQGESDAVLRRGVGHLADTALPGAGGNVVLAGHRDTYFRALEDVRRGDVISVRTLDGDYEYVVESTDAVAPTDLRVLEPTDTATLTLITCFPFRFVGAAPDRFIVRARLRPAAAEVATVALEVR